MSGEKGTNLRIPTLGGFLARKTVLEWMEGIILIQGFKQENKSFSEILTGTEGSGGGDKRLVLCPSLG